MNILKSVFSGPAKFYAGVRGLHPEGQPIAVLCTIIFFILLHEKFLQFDWLSAVVFLLNLKYLLVKITNLLRVVV